MGGAGMFSTSLIVPKMGKWFDEAKASAIAAGSSDTVADGIAGSDTFVKVAMMPAVLLVVFVLIYLYKRKDYMAEKSSSHA
jgi:hypothetical protein